MFRFADPGGRAYGAAGNSQINIQNYWTQFWVPTQASWSVSAGNGRSGGSCLRCSVAGSFPYAIFKTLDAQSTWGIAFGFKTGIIGAAGACLCFCNDNGTNTNNQVNLLLNIDGSLSVTRNSTVLGTTVGQAVFANTYVHLEMLTTINPTSGSCQLWVNGISRINVTGVNTRATSNSSANVVGIGTITAGYSSTNWDYDDIIVYDGQGTDSNGFTDIHSQIGDCAVYWLSPTGIGALNQFTPNSGINNYACINDFAPDGDNTYVSSSGVGNIDLYALSGLPLAATQVLTVATLTYARKDDTGSRTMVAELRSSGINTSHASGLALGNSYQYFFENWGQNPATGVPLNWTPSMVNVLQVGQKVLS